MYQYTQTDIDELTRLANEARALDAEWRAVMVEVQAVLDREVNGGYCGWQEYHPELTDIDAAMTQDFRVAPYEQMPLVGQFARRPARAAEWQRLNNRCRREIAQARKAVVAHANP